jgi:hypothetical protein
MAKNINVFSPFILTAVMQVAVQGVSFAFVARASGFKKGRERSHGFLGG